MKLSVAPPNYDQDDQARLRGALEQADRQTLKRGIAAPELLLRAPNGGVWRLTVSDGGVLGVTAV